MGVRSLLHADPLEVARRTIDQSADKIRREEAQKRVDLYLDRSEKLLRTEIYSLFQSREVQKLIEPFISMGACQGLFKRIVDEVARPVYSTPPVRTTNPENQEALSQLVHETRLNEKMDLSCRLVEATNHVWVFPRYVERLNKILVEVLTPNCVTVIPDPDDPSMELALIYDSWMYDVKGSPGTRKKLYVYWDDEETFRFDDTFHLVPMATGEPIRLHGLGRIPQVSIRRHEAWGGNYFNDSSGTDLYKAHIVVSWLTSLVCKLHRSLGEKQLVYEGDPSGIPRGQIIDAGSALIAGEGTTVSLLDLTTDPGHYLKTIDDIILRVAANHGLNVDRLNQKTSGNPAAEVGLLERRAEAIRVFWRAEHDLFDVLKLISREHPFWQLSEDAPYQVDFGEITTRVDRLTQLKIREEEERMGLRNRLDDVMEDEAEITTKAAAEARYLENLKIRQWRVEQERALNAPHDLDKQGVGRAAEVNGAMGPIVRDTGPTPEEKNAEKLVQILRLIEPR